MATLKLRNVGRVVVVAPRDVRVWNRNNLFSKPGVAKPGVAKPGT